MRYGEPAAWNPKICIRCRERPIAGRVGGGYGKKAYLCWWCAFPDQEPPACKVCGTESFWTAGYCRNCHPRATVRSCLHCMAWGPVVVEGASVKSFWGSLCYACHSWKHRPGTVVESCAHCHRMLPLHNGSCRLCWVEAGRRLGGAGRHHRRIFDGFERDPSHQLFFVAMLRRLRLAAPARSGQRIAEPAPPTWRPPAGVQGVLFHCPRDLGRFVRDVGTDLDDPRLRHARALARHLAEERGWSKPTSFGVDRALVMALAGEPDDGRQVRYSDLVGLAGRKISVERTAEVLREMHLLQDDRADRREAWIAEQLVDLTPRIRTEIQHWIAYLRGELPRSTPRPREAVPRELTYLRPTLLEWSGRYDSLREVTRADVKAVVYDPELSLQHRRHVLAGLRNLFRRLKRDQLIFRNPVTHLSLPEPGLSANVGTLPDEELARAFAWATGKPERAILVALAGAQALQPTQMRELLLEDVDLGARTLRRPNGEPQPLHQLTHDALVAYLDYRRRRWPTSTNPHLLITQQTAAELGPASPSWHKLIMRPLGITLTQLRQDRFLDELRAAGPDPLHFQVVFERGWWTAIKYVRLAEQLFTDDPRFQRSAEREPTV